MMRPLRLAFLVRCLCLVLLCSQLQCWCFSSPVAITRATALVALSAEVVELLGNLAGAVTDFYQMFSTINATADGSIKQKKDPVELVNYLEENRDKLHAQYSQVNIVFGELYSKSTEYFTELDMNTAAIPDKKVREREVALNLKKKSEWIKEYSNAAKNIRALSASLGEYETAYRVIRNQILRGQIDVNIQELRALSGRVSMLNTQVKTFKNKTQPLFSAQGQPN